MPSVDTQRRAEETALYHVIGESTKLVNVTFDKTGRKLTNIPIPEPWTGNVVFGGKDRHLLFITASRKVFGVKMRVKGAY